MKGFLIIVLSLANLVTLGAQETKPTLPDPYAWTVKVYRFPADELRSGFVTRDRGQMHAPAMPAPNATTEQIRQFLKSSNDAVTQYLLLQGIPMLKGSLAVLDVEHDVLVVRTANATQDVIAGLAKAYVDRLAMYVSINVHIMEADSTVVRQLVSEAPLHTDHTVLWDRLQALAAQGQARQVGTINYDTRSGQRAKLSRGTQRRYATGFSMNESDAFEVSSDTRNVGTALEIDPVIGPDAVTLDFNLALEHDFLRPTDRWEPAAQKGQQRIETHVTDFHLAKTTTAITLRSGMTNLLSVWSPESSPSASKVMQAAFLKAEIVPLLPLADARIEEMLKTHGEAVEPTPPPSKKLPNEGLPPGMILRRFRVPPNFLSASASGGAAAVPADPFSSAAAPRDEPRAMRSVTALDVLKMQGIPFPEGSSANYVQVAGELIVRNTPENMEKIEELLQELSKKSPMMLGLTIHVVQADGALLRRLASEMNTLADHRAAWKAVEEAAGQGTATFLRTGWLETRSGQRATFEAITDYMHAGAPSFGKGEKPATGEGKIDSSPRLVSVEHETNPVGFRFEVDPVIGPDGETIDLNIALNYDTAAPSQHFEPAGGAEKVLRVDSPSTDFFKTDVTTALTLKSGAIRLLGVWKPDGKADTENADVLQAAFVRVNLMKIEDTPNKKP